MIKNYKKTKRVPASSLLSEKVSRTNEYTNWFHVILYAAELKKAKIN